MKVRTNKSSAKATRIFTDREEPRGAFWKKYATVRSEMELESNVHVLNYYGIGGIGKSSLLKKLISEMDEQLKSPRYIYIDLNVCQESRTVLDRMKNKLAENHKFSFPLFELGSYVYAKKVGENADPVEVEQLTEKSPLLSMMLSVTGEIPVVGIAAKVLSYADQGVAFIRTHLKNHNRELKQIEIMEAEDLYKYLPYLFAQDMAHNLEKKADEPLVIFIDTYEKLVNELSSVGEPLKFDEWIRGENGLVQNIPNVLWVIAGREKLKWELFDSEWSNALETHILGSLSSADSDHFLLNAGITNVELRKQLYELTDGTPVYLDLCVDQFMRMLDNGTIPEISMFGKNTFELIERFVRYMGETQKDLVYMLACLNKWDDKLIADIAPNVLPNFSFSAYEKTKDYSFVIISDDGYYNIHQTVGSVLVDNCPDLIKQSVGKGLLEKYSKVLESRKLFSAEFATALTYATQAGLLLHEDRDEFMGFYKEKIYDSLYDLIVAGKAEQAKTIFEIALEKAEQNQSDLLYAQILRDSSVLERVSCNYSRSNELAIKAVDLYSEILGSDHIDTLKALANLARSYELTGKYKESLELKQTLLKKSESLLGENHQFTLNAMSGLAGLYIDLANYTEALSLYNKVYEALKTDFGSDHPDTIKTLYNLSVAYNYIGEHQKAIELRTTVIEKRTAVLGENDPETINAIHGLANLYYILGDYTKALELQQTVIEKRKEVLGEEHPDVLWAISALAETLERLGEYDQALKLRQEILEKRQSIFGDEHLDTLKAKNNLAISYEKMKEYDKALELRQAIVEKRKELLGESHPDTISAINNLSFTLEYIGQQDKALNLRETVVDKRSAVFGENHPSSIQALRNLAFSYENANEKEKAIELMISIVNKRKNVLGENHILTLASEYDLSRLFFETGDYQKAKEITVKLFPKYRRLLGYDHSDTYDCLHQLAGIYYFTEEYNKALILEKTLLERSGEIYGKNHPKAISAMKRLIFIYRKTKQFDEERVLLKNIYDIMRESYGEDNIKTVDALFEYAYWYSEHFEQSKSQKLFHLAVDGYRKILGDDHPKVIEAMFEEAFAYYFLFEREKAFNLFNDVYEKISLLPECTYPKPLNVLGFIASCLYNMEEYGKSLETYMDLFEKQVMSLGENNKEAVKTEIDIARVYEKTNKLEDALKFYLSAYEKMCSSDNFSDYDVRDSLKKVVTVLLKLDETKKAIDLREKELNTLKIKFGEKHIDTIRAQCELASVISETGDLDKALEMYQNAYDLICSLLGAEDMQTNFVLAGLESVYLKLGQPDKAIELRKFVAEKRIEILGENHKSSVNAMKLLAQIYAKLDELQKAADIYRIAYESNGQTQKQDIFDTETIVKGFTSVLLQLKRTDEAIALNKEHIELTGLKNGQKHKRTIRAMRFLAKTYDEIGEKEQATALREEIEKLEEVD